LPPAAAAAAPARGPASLAAAIAKVLSLQVQANAWEKAALLSPLAAWLAFMALDLLAGSAGDGLVQGLAKSLAGAACAGAEVFLFCRVLHIDWGLVVSVMVIVNLTMVVAALFLLPAILARKRRDAIVFVGKRRHWLAALLLLAMSLLWIWGYFLYWPKFRSYGGSFVIVLLSVSALEMLRGSVANLLQPPRHGPGQRNFLRAPRRRARFAPGVETGEKDAK
jgi:hypothetical protein